MSDPCHRRALDTSRQYATAIRAYSLSCAGAHIPGVQYGVGQFESIRRAFGMIPFPERVIYYLGIQRKIERQAEDNMIALSFRWMRTA